MKKARRFLFFVLMATLALLVLVGCDKKDKISSISLKDHDPNTVIEMAVGNFDYSAYTLVMTYESGKTEELALTEEMIEETDLFKFYQVGDHDIKISYERKEYVFKISVKRSEFGELRFPENIVFLYDGTEHKVEIEGELPANAVVTYPKGNVFMNAGVYDVTAVITCDGYVTKTLAASVKIERATYDMSGVAFESKEFVYDGANHSIAISGELPEGVSEPTYYIDGNKTASAVEVGEYLVKATFTTENPNYNLVNAMEATLKILPAEYDLSGLDFIFKDAEGELIEGRQTDYDGSVVTFAINNSSLLSKKVDVSYTVTDESGVVISTSNINSSIKDAGVYTVKAEFTLLDHKNYKAIEPLVRTFEVKKVQYDLTEIHFDSARAEYDGERHKLSVTLPTAHDVKVEDITYEYYLDGEKLTLDGKNIESVADAGEYTVVAKFNVRNPNYQPIEDMQATLLVEKKQIDPSLFAFASGRTFAYTGKAPTLVFDDGGVDHLVYEWKFYKVEGETLTEVSETVEIGKYRCVMTASVESSNYIFKNGAESLEFACDFEIVRADG